MSTTTKKPEEFEEKLTNVLELWHKGEYKRAIDVIEYLVEKYPEIVSAHGVAGSIYYDLKRYREAAVYFKKVTEITPKSERASLGLFNSLWELGRTDEAFDEMNRFLKIASSKEYDLLLEGFLKEGR